MVIFSLFVQMSEGATYAVVPFINKKALGTVTGIVAAGGNIGAVAAGFLFRNSAIAWPTSLLIIGVIILACSFLVLLIQFSPEDEKLALAEMTIAINARNLEEKALVKKPAISIPQLLTNIKPMDALRVFLGGALAVKGIYFILNIQEIETLTGTIGQFQTVTSWYVIFAHIIGGMCFFVGLATRLAGIINIPILAGAIFFVHFSEGLLGNQGMQFSVFVLVALLLCIWNGPGIFSLDHILNKNNSQKRI